MKKIVVTNEKGGTGKSTICCLLIDYLSWKGKKVGLTDTDPIQTSQNWIDNSLEEGRKILSFPVDYQIIDTPGSNGASLNHLQAANLIVVPFRSHYADLQTTINWFLSLNANLQRKVLFVPNQWQGTKEQREGLSQLQKLVAEEKVGFVSSFYLTHRPALYGPFLNGGKENFFASKKLPNEVNQLMEEILSHENN